MHKTRGARDYKFQVTGYEDGETWTEYISAMNAESAIAKAHYKAQEDGNSNEFIRCVGKSFAEAV